MTTSAIDTPKELTVTRTFDAPLSAVWKAWTDPKQVQQWWGPTGFTNPVCEWNAKPGNKIHIDMKAPDGTVYPMGGEFVEVVPGKKLVFTSLALDAQGVPVIEARNSVTFKEENGKTVMTLHVSASSLQPIGETYLQGMNEGWTQSLGRLEELVAKPS
jgi:uncharacterized protein YndB with AHSA1/START domain